MHQSWIVLLPPLIVLLVSSLTKKIVPSLLVGILLAAFISQDFRLLPSLSVLVKSIQGQLFQSDNLFIFSFLLLLGALISLITLTGGTQAYAQLIKKKIKTARSAETASVILSMILLFDDFFSSITVGSIMRPLTDHFRIPRVKLAFLIDSMAAPMVILMPISSWVGTLTMQLAKAGVKTCNTTSTLIQSEPFNLYLQSIPFIFYSIFLFASVIIIIYRRISFGPMKRHETSQRSPEQFQSTLEKNLSSMPVPHGTFWDFLIPIFMLITTIFIALLWSGNYCISPNSVSIIHALSQANVFFALFIGSIVSLLVSISYFLMRKKINFNQIWLITRSGYDLMGSSIVILLCAWVFSSLLINELHSGIYLGYLVSNTLSINLLPALFFLIATITSIAIGSSWGTLAILIPLAIPMMIKMTGLTPPLLPHEVPLLLPLIGSIFAGAVAGDHISPLSSTTVMSATSTGITIHEHINTQFLYAVPALLATFVSYLVAGYFISSGVWLSLTLALPVGIATCYCLLHLGNIIHSRQSKNINTF